MITKPIDVTDATFATAVLQSDLPVVVDFWGERCLPCKMINSWMARLAQAYAGQIVVARINVDNNKETIAACDVRSVPTILFMAKGNVYHCQVDKFNEADLRGLVDAFLDRLQAEAAAP